MVRSTLQCLAAVLGGAQSIHVMGYDEALEIPTEESVRLSLRTQQIIAHESGVTRTVDPLAGSYFVESLTSELQHPGAGPWSQEVDAGGGYVHLLEQGVPQRWIAEAAYRTELEVQSGARVKVGVNQFTGGGEDRPPRLFEVDSAAADGQRARLASRLAGRDAARAARALAQAQGGGHGGRQHHARLPRRGPGGLHRGRDRRRAAGRVRRAPGTGPMVTPPPAKPLAGIRVLDLTRFVSGAYCTMVLDALGADVIKVEGLPGGDPYRAQGAVQVGSLSGLFASLNTGKRSIAVDLRAPDGTGLVRTLAQASDVFVENARPGSLERAGLGPDRLHALNPRLVYASISGFGQAGPDAARGGFDLILQAASGIMAVTGNEAGGPVKVGAPVLDIGAGMSAATAIMAALFARAADGLGRTVSSSLLEFALSCFTSYAADILETGTSPGLLGNDSPQFAPYGVFRCRDGSLALAGAGSESLWLKLCDVLGRPDWPADPRFATNADRLRHRPELTAEIERVLTRETAAHWQLALDGAGIPASPVLPPAAALTSAQAEALQIRQAARTPDGYGYQTVRPPLAMSAPPAGGAAPRLLTRRARPRPAHRRDPPRSRSRPGGHHRPGRARDRGRMSRASRRAPSARHRSARASQAQANWPGRSWTGPSRCAASRRPPGTNSSAPR